MSQQIPRTLHSECPECDDETLHKTLKGRFKGKKRLELVLKCSVCGKVREEVLEAVSQVPVRMIISRGDVSEKVQAEFPADWQLAVGDEFMHDDERLQISGIESGGQRIDSCSVKDVQTLWTINFDKAKVRVAINRGNHTRSIELEVDPEEEFEVGSEIEIDDVQVTIHSIKTKHKRLRSGMAEARDIVRVYCTDNRPARRPGRRSR